LKKEEIIRLYLDYNFNISLDALNYLSQKNIPKEVIKRTIEKIPQDTTVVTLTILEKFLEPISQLYEQKIEEKDENIEINTYKKENYADTTKKEYISNEIDIEKKKTVDLPISSEYTPPNINIRLDIPEKPVVKPDTLAFRRLFENRFHQLSTILLNNLPSDEKILKRSLSAEESTHDRSGIIIGMVQDTKVLHTGKFVIQLEDPDINSSTNCVMVQDSETFPEFRQIVRDSVIGVSGILPKNFREGVISAFWGKEVIRPGFSPIKSCYTTNSHRILFIADIHFGSKYFSQRIFSKLINILTLKDLRPEYEKIVSEIDIVIIAGDLVDGIGRFSDQKNHVSLNTIQEQYKALATLLTKIPSHIQIIIIPGEHDATQVALPQPAIDRNIAKDLVALPNIRSHGNPLRLTIDEISLLIFHGQGNETLFQKKIRSKSFNPILGLQQLLEYRHLCPEYGLSTPIAPFDIDYLVIDEVPDIFITGHFHKAQFQEYKGVKIITCGTFQKYQSIDKSKSENGLSLGIFPTVNTKTGKVDMIDLNKL
jgi:DNA polymerase II small subunit